MAHHTLSARRGLLRSAFVLASLAATAACGPDKPVTPAPPVAIVGVPNPNTVGTSLKLVVSVSGCDTVQSLTLLDHGEKVKGLPNNVGETQVELAKNEVPYKGGIAASLSFTAKAVCNDGRASESQPAAATFFPVETLVASTNNLQVVPDYFVAEGSGSSVTFLGCGTVSTGQSYLYRVSALGDVQQQVQMPFVCNAGTTISDKYGASGLRWVWTANAGVMAINSSFQIVALPSPQLRVTSLVVGPNGDAIASDDAGNIVRLLQSGTGNIIKWTYSLHGGSLMGTPIFRADQGKVLLPLYAGGTGSATGTLYVEGIDYNAGPTSNGGPASHSVLKYIYDPDAIPPAAALSGDGKTMYLAFHASGDQTLVVACSVDAVASSPDAATCELQSPGLLWESSPVDGRVALLLPYAGGARLAAIAAQRAWFLDPNNKGAVLNKGGAALTPTGGLSVLSVQQGVGVNQDFYLLNGAGSSTIEVVATDRAENGPLFHYQVPSGDLTLALDASGAVWMRIGKSLVKTLPLADYRNALPK